MQLLQEWYCISYNYSHGYQKKEIQFTTYLRDRRRHFAMCNSISSREQQNLKLKISSFGLKWSLNYMKYYNFQFIQNIGIYRLFDTQYYNSYKLCESKGHNFDSSLVIKALYFHTWSLSAYLAYFHLQKNPFL